MEEKQLDLDDLRDRIFDEVLEKLNIKDLYYNGKTDTNFTNHIYDECWECIDELENSITNLCEIIEEDFEKELNKLWSKQ